MASQRTGEEEFVRVDIEPVSTNDEALQIRLPASYDAQVIQVINSSDTVVFAVEADGTFGGVFTATEDPVFSFAEAGGDSARGLYVKNAAIAGTKAYRQGVLAVELTRAAGQEDTVWDGNPDTAVNISASVTGANAVNEGAVRGLQVSARNKGTNINWVLGVNIGARNDSGKQAAQVHGLDVRIENYGNVATEIVGIDINLSDENSNVDPHTKHGLRIRNTDQSGMGAVDGAIHISHTSTNGFDALIHAATATGDGFVASVATPAGDTTHAMIVNIAGTLYYIPVYAAVTF